ncbi:hypothetical protein WMY93_016736 [Mugilogobius chulae]|uniref:Uncharacterized protein n=1 Tax=Mugilogobius chulae TaxID=88201 RepID=A0AAW0NYE2_9GOBI
MIHSPPIAFSTLISDPSLSNEAECICESTAPNPEEEEDSEDAPIEITVPAAATISEATSHPNVDDTSESPAPSLDMNDIRENIVHVAEDPSILNQAQLPLHHIGDGESNIELKAVPFGNTNVEQEADKTNVETPLIQVNGEPAQEPNSTPSINDIQKPIDLKQPDSGEKTRSLNSRYILTAAGVGACALLIAWRFKH